MDRLNLAAAPVWLSRIGCRKLRARG